MYRCRHDGIGIINMIGKHNKYFKGICMKGRVLGRKHIEERVATVAKKQNGTLHK
jgi:hypothetical protein